MPKLHKKMMISWRTLGLSVLFSVLVGLTVAGEPIDRLTESAIGRLAWRPVSGDIVVVGIDDKTLNFSPNSSFSVKQYARVIDTIDRADAKRLFIDIDFARREDDPDFGRLTAAVKRMRDRIILGVMAQSTKGTTATIAKYPSPKFGTEFQVASLGWAYEYWQVWTVPLAVQAGNRLVPSLSALLADQHSNRPAEFHLDLSYDTNSITEYSATDVLTGKVGKRELSGKDVILAPTATTLQDVHYLPGHDQVKGSYIHLVAAETLKRGQPIDIGWIPALLLSLALLWGGLIRRNTKWFGAISLATVITLISCKALLSTMLVSSSIAAGVILATVVFTIVTRNRRRFSAQQQNPISGLPNFEALRSQQPFGSHTIIGAKLVNYEDLAAFLPGEGSQQLIEQVSRRLQLASGGTQLFHDLDGTFAWLVPYYQHSQIENQLAGLAALFNAPLTIGELRVDVAIAFGINDELEGSNAQRLAAGLLAAEKSIRTRSLWTKYSSRENEAAGWQLSFHSQLEDAMARGDIWVAYQPQYDLKTQKLVGVEALARWTHPDRGTIPPDEFITQAEKSQDIYRLTLFVMDQAIQSAAQLHAREQQIHMSVNMSAALLDHNDLVGTIRVMLTAHHLPPEMLTIEVTETAQIENSAQARKTLAQLRRAGMRLSIDDYGTGQSNLEYLTEIEADEIKIDKRFVLTMCESPRNLEVVKSTIDLAHRLNAVAVAEGIEDATTMALLNRMGCDIGQGYYLGKPQLLSDLTDNLDGTFSEKSA